MEPIFHDDSYGYRPGESAHDALEATRRRCWKYDWLLEFDIKGLFDNIDHELMTELVRRHTNVPWIRLYIGRWLTAPIADSLKPMKPMVIGQFKCLPDPTSRKERP